MFEPVGRYGAPVFAAVLVVPGRGADALRPGGTCVVI